MIRIKKTLKYGVCTAILVGLFICFSTRKNEVDTDDDKAAKFDNFLVVPSIFLDKTKYFYNNNYKNSNSLREKLKPKLSGKLKTGNKEDLWNDIGAAHNAQDLKIRDEGYKLYAFNTLVSSRLSLDREIKDTRHKTCRNISYSSKSILPTASVIICFYREDFTVLMRTIHSVVNRSPKENLKEIIVINDQSDLNIIPNITDHLHQMNWQQNFVKVYTAPERLGLIRARIFGARKATGDVLVFLDSHVETNVQWLEPMLDRIHGDRTRVVTPIIDIVNADTFNYEPSPLVRGGFNWGLNFKWDAIPRSELQTDQDFVKPFKSPTMAGGLFAMDRKYFHELGEYDPGMQVCTFFIFYVFKSSTALPKWAETY